MTNVSPHRSAADRFTEAVLADLPEEVAAIRLFGSVARGDERGVHSDVDLLVELTSEDPDGSIEEAIRTIAYDIELESGVPVSVIVVPETAVQVRADHPFFRRVRRDGVALYG